MGSECGCLPIPEEKIVKKWRLQPGKMFLVDLEKGRIVDDKELKDTLASAKPYAEWIERIRVKLDEVESEKTRPLKSAVALLDRQQAFGYTQEDLKFILQPMSAAGEEPVGSMGNDSPLAVLSNKNKTRLPLLQAALRAGHEPGDRPDPRGAGDVARLVHRAEAQPARHRRAQPAAAPGRCRSRCSTSTRWRRSGTSSATPAASSGPASSTSPIPSRGARRRSRRASPRSPRRPRTRCARATRSSSSPTAWSTRSASRFRRCSRSVGDPPAPRRQGPAHLDRPGGRDRQRARSAPLRAARRLRRRGRASVPRARDRARRRRRTRARRSRTTSRRSARD